MKKLLFLLVVAGLSFSQSATAAPARPTKIDDGQCLVPAVRRHNTDWFREAKWGVFVHYLWHIQSTGKRPANMGKSTDWDTCVKEFDTEKFAEQLKQAGAGYVIVTAMQLSRYMIAPNDTYNRLTGFKPGEACATRDLVEDLYQSLHKRGIVLMLYWTGDGPRWDKQACKGLGYTPGDPVPFVKNWAAVAAEYGERYKDKVAGWWVDGCYTHAGYNEEKWSILAKGLRAGNPKRIIALNSPGYLATSRTLNDDFTTGEVTSFGETSAFRWRDGVQWHLLSYLGGKWCSPGVRYGSEWMADYVRRANFSGGVISVDVLLFRDGSIDAAQLKCLTEMNRRMKALQNMKPTPPGNLASGKPANCLYADGHQSRGIVGGNYAMCGVDGDSATVAQASGKGNDPLSWAYEVDLLKNETIGQVGITFGKGYATHFKIAVSMDGEKWTVVHEKQGHDGSKVKVEIKPVTARYVQIIGLKPDAPRQRGNQMQIAEIEIYSSDH